LAELPSNLGRYRLVERISVGGMAEIFRAKATGEVGFEKEVAVKRILPHLATDREFVDMFIDEARTVAQLNHSNICQIFEFGQVDGAYFIAIELVDGKDVREMMVYHRRLRQPMPVSIIMHIIGKACEALEYAHTSKDSGGAPMHIVHRDVSPQNVLVSYQGMVKLIDFGIAKAMGRLTKTQAGSIKGKFSYMSPEQVMAQPIDHRSDIFAAGTVLWECLTNKRLFKGENEIITMQMVRRAEITPPSEINPLVPPNLDPIVLRALAKDPNDRYQTAGELLDDLEDFAIQADLTCTTSEASAWIRETFAKEYRKLKEKRAAPDNDGVMLLRTPKSTARMGSEAFTAEAREPDRPPQVIIGDGKKEDEVALLATLAAPGDEFLGEKTPIGIGVPPRPPPDKTPSGTGPGRPLPVVVPPAADDMDYKETTPLDDKPAASIQQPTDPGLEGGGLEPIPTVEDPIIPIDTEDAGISFVEASHSGVSEAAAAPLTLDDPAGAESREAQFSSQSGLMAVPTVEDASPFEDDFNSYSQRHSRSSKKPFFVAICVIAVLLCIAVVVLLSRGDKKEPAAPAGATAGGKAPKTAARKQPPAKQAAPAAPVAAAGDPAAAQPGEPEQAPAGEPQPAAGKAPVEGHAAAAPAASGGAARKPAGKAAPRRAATPGKRKVAASGGKEEDLPDFNYIPEGSRAVHYIKKEEELKEGEGDLPAPKGDAAQKPAVELKEPAKEQPATKQPDEEPVQKVILPDEKPAAPAPAPAAAATAPAAAPTPKPAPAPAAAAPAPAAKGRLIASTIPWAYVWVDGKKTGRSTPISESNPIRLSPGKHKITFEKDGQKFNFSVTIKPGETTSLVKRLPVKKEPPAAPKAAPKAAPEAAPKPAPKE